MERNRARPLVTVVAAAVAFDPVVARLILNALAPARAKPVSC